MNIINYVAQLQYVRLQFKGAAYLTTDSAINYHGCYKNLNFFFFEMIIQDNDSIVMLKI